LNAWATDNLHAKIGDTVKLTYFEPESVDGRIREKTVALRLAAIVKLSGAAGDRSLTPTVKGITDELTMADWDPPFPFDAKRVRPTDENVLGPSRPDTQGIRLIGNRPAAVGQPFRPNHVDPRGPERSSCRRRFQSPISFYL